MSVYLNPFYARASEQHRDAHRFVTTFGPGALDMLPGAVWDRLVLLRSSPGAGKTSLMRLFLPENLEWARKRSPHTEPVRQALMELGAIDEQQTRKLGVLIDLDRDYRSLLDLPLNGDVGRKLFFRLLDVRILVGVLRSTLSLTGLSFPEAVGDFRFDADGDCRVEALLERLGGPDGAGIHGYARSTERSILRMLDALLESDVAEIPEGHSELYSLTVLAQASVLVGTETITAQPMIMFDDGHILERPQRDALLAELRRRRPTVARWYSERFEALSHQELLAGVGIEGRDVALVELDAIAREGSNDGKRFTRGRYDRVLADIARRRAAHQLSTYAQENQEFLELLDEDRDAALGSEAEGVIQELETRVRDLEATDDRYKLWVDHARSLTGFEAATAWRELEVLINRDQNRQPGFFEDTLSTDDISARSSAALRDAAALSVADEFKIPYYGGSSMVTQLGSHNAHQFLNVCGDLFAEMLVDVSLGRPPHLDVARQHRVLRQASERFWESIPRTVPHGRDVQALVREIVAISVAEKAKPRLPYPPGVTGTAILMAERKLLLDPKFREATPGAERLFAALASAVAHNILNADLDYSVKRNRYMVLYLNRLLCPRFMLPLGYGSFRERRLQVMIGWMRKLPALGNRPRELVVGERLNFEA